MPSNAVPTVTQKPTTVSTTPTTTTASTTTATTKATTPTPTGNILKNKGCFDDFSKTDEILMQCKTIAVADVLINTHGLF